MGRPHAAIHPRRRRRIARRDARHRRDERPPREPAQGLPTTDRNAGAGLLRPLLRLTPWTRAARPGAIARLAAAPDSVQIACAAHPTRITGARLEPRNAADRRPRAVRDRRRPYL